MSNVEQYIKQLPTKLTELKTIFSGGLTVSGTDLTSIVTNTSDTVSNTADLVTNTAAVYACIDHINNHLEVDTNAINGVTMSVNSGTNDAGTQRMTIATDDTIKNPIKVMSGFGAPNLYVGNSTNCQVIGAVRNDASGVVGGTDQCFTPLSVDQNGRLYIDLKRVGGTAIDTNSGSKSAGSQRVVIATDDINLAAINTNTGTIATRTQPLTNSQFDINGTKNIAVCTKDTSTLAHCALGIGLARQDFAINPPGWSTFISSGPGNVATDPTYTDPGADNTIAHGCPRVCIATDDVNTANMSTKLNSIYTILNDVWDSTNHYLRTHAV